MRKSNKRIHLLFLLFLLLAGGSAGVFAQTATDAEKRELETLGKTIVDSYKLGAYDEALKAVLKALPLSIKINGEQSKAVATMYFNLGAINNAKKEEKPAIDNFQKALSIYQQNFPGEKVKLQGILKEIGLIYYRQQENKEAEKYLLEALALSEEIYGEEHKETVDELGYLAFIYMRKNDDLRAESYLFRAREGALKAYGGDSNNYEMLNDTYSCFASNVASDEVAEIIAARRAKNPGTPASGSVINGKAIKLIQPKYPQNTNGQGGKVTVKVTIDETGKIIKARAYCGPAVFWKASESAALQSTFSPTLLSGKAVKVSGLIVYNFAFIPLKPKN